MMDFSDMTLMYINGSKMPIMNFMNISAGWQFPPGVNIMLTLKKWKFYAIIC